MSDGIADWIICITYQGAVGADILQGILRYLSETHAGGSAVSTWVKAGRACAEPKPER